AANSARAKSTIISCHDSQNPPQSASIAVDSTLKMTWTIGAEMGSSTLERLTRDDYEDGTAYTFMTSSGEKVALNVLGGDLEIAHKDKLVTCDAANTTYDEAHLKELIAKTKKPPVVLISCQDKQDPTKNGSIAVDVKHITWTVGADMGEATLLQLTRDAY